MFHQLYPKKPEKAFRKFDGKTPYGVHPTLLAMLLLHEESLPEEFRMRGAVVLLGHDLLGDTKLSDLPLWCDQYGTWKKSARSLICELTFSEDSNPSEEIWNRSDEAKLLKFYDVVVNLMCVGAMTPERVKYRCEQAERHLTWVEEHFPQLQIIRIAKGLLGL